MVETQSVALNSSHSKLASRLLESWVPVAILSSSIYAYFVATSSSSVDSLVTIAFLCVICGYFVAWSRAILRNDEGVVDFDRVLGFSALLHVGIVIGLTLAGSPEKYLWVADTHSTHLPGAELVAKAIKSGSGFSEIFKGPLLNRVFFTHVLVGLFFTIFGVNVYASSLAMLVMKMGALFFTYRLAKKLFDDKIALIAALTYAFVPTILFYTSIFTKEAAIQLFVAMAMYGLYGLLVEKRISHGLLFFGAICMLGLERFYLLPPFVLIAIIQFLVTRRIPIKTRLSVVFGLLVVAAAFVGILSQTYDLSRLASELARARNAYNAYSDVNRTYNIDLNYFLSLFKITFTPFFTANKFVLFSDFSYILIWGAPINQLVILGSLAGCAVCLRANWRRHWYYWVPFVFFLILFAYLAPYSGRQRDSFYPILSIYFAHFFVGLSKVGLRYFRVRDPLNEASIERSSAK